MYTIENWKSLKADLGLDHKAIAEIIGTSLQNVKQSTAPKVVADKGLPAWARAMLYVWKQNVAINPDDLKIIIDKAKGIFPEHKVIDCGCHVDGSGIFRRLKDSRCTLPRENHQFEISR